MKIVVLFAVFCAVSLADAASAQCDKFAYDNYSALRNITYFSYSLIEAQTPWNAQRPYEREYYCIKNGANPGKDFESLLENSTLEGQLYGLMGLSEVSPERYEIVKSKYEKKHEFVLFLSFDVGHYIPASKIALTFLTRLEEAKQARIKWDELRNSPERRRQIAEDKRQLEELRRRDASKTAQPPAAKSQPE